MNKFFKYFNRGVLIADLVLAVATVCLAIVLY